MLELALDAELSSGASPARSSLPGSVLDATGEFVADSRVVARSGSGREIETRTLADGSFRFEALPDGRHAISLRDETLDPALATPPESWVEVRAGRVTPSRLALTAPLAAGEVRGAARVDGVGREASVLVIDRHGKIRRRVRTDAFGNYTVRLPAGEFGLVAQFLNGETARRVDPTWIRAKGELELDLRHLASGVSDPLRVETRQSGELRTWPVLVSDTSTSAPVAVIELGEGQDFAKLLLDDGEYRVQLLRSALPPNVLAPAPVHVRVSKGVVEGTDLEGPSLVDGTLVLDPSPATEEGKVRDVVSEFLSQLANASPEAIEGLHAETMWSGLDREKIRAIWPLRGEWSRTGRRFDSLEATATRVDDWTWIVAVTRGRESWIAADGSVRETHWNETLRGSREWALLVRRDALDLPWRVAGNGQPFESARVERERAKIVSVDGETTLERLIVEVEEGTDPLLSVSISGAGITSGRLERDDATATWSGVLSTDALESGPPSFFGDLDSLSSDTAYTVRVIDSLGTATEHETRVGEPSSEHFPSIKLFAEKGEARLKWQDIASRLDAELASVDVTVVRLLADGFEPLLVERGLPADRVSITLPESARLETGDELVLEVRYRTTGGATQTCSLETLWRGKE